MRNLALISFFLLVIQLPASGFRDSFQAATELFNAQLYDSAAHRYEEIISEGYYSSSLFYNTGNCYYLSGNYVLATYYFIKAKQLDPADESIQHNLKLARSELLNEPAGYELTDVPWIEMIIRSKPVNYWSWLALILLNLSFAGLILIRFRPALQNRSLILASSYVLLAAGIMFGTLSWYSLKTLEKNYLGMIVVENPGLYTAPSSTGSISQTIIAGTIVKIEEQTDQWLLVKNDSFRGWIKKETLKLF